MATIEILGHPDGPYRVILDGQEVAKFRDVATAVTHFAMLYERHERLEQIAAELANFAESFLYIADGGQGILCEITRDQKRELIATAAAVVRRYKEGAECSTKT